ncbi:acyltransferase (plasmid) [Halarchaeum sp. CBA1220]|uniref:acyltransferase n=1 Tax=Halarchaeum sp. CBA1220 TaxID=1853682 RepID=UPI000F3A8E02|nr:acyltransferase [Halarchaeum sp. CBA1220]QLC35106.1 acyltransferase [Halarchaeum sp. CBA1220]
MVLKAIGIRGLIKTLWNYPHISGRGLRVLFGRKTHIDIHNKSTIICAGKFLFGINTSAVHDSRGGSRLEIGRDGKLIISAEDGAARMGPAMQVRINGEFTMSGPSYISGDSYIVCDSQIEIGKGCAISWGVDIMDSNMHHIEESGTEKPIKNPISIGDNVWIGANATVLPGVEIGDGAIIAANSVITNDVDTETLVGGAPARTIQKNVDWH